MHGSQKKIEDNISGYTFSIEVIPNFELEQLILSFGEKLTVKSPNNYREKILKRIESSFITNEPIFINSNLK